MIIIKSKDEIDIMKIPAKATAEILTELKTIIKPGISTYDIDQFVESEILRNNMIPAFKGYNGYPASACVSVNEEVVHGIPSPKNILCEGDVVSVDAGAIYKGFYSDAARTYAVGEISEESRRLIEVTRESFFLGMKFCKAGNYLSDISNAIQQHVEAAGFGVIRDYVGHGLGRDMHEAPSIPNYGKAGRGPKLRPGMVLAIEPMVAQGTYEVNVLPDGWTAVTCDGKYAAHYENTVVVTDGDPEIITLLKGEE